MRHGPRSTPRLLLSLSVIFTNIRSFLPKRDVISNLVSSSSSNILVLSETWLHSDISDHEVLADLPNFTVFRNDRIDRRGGGVAVAISKDISCNCINIQTDLEIIWLLCHATPETVLIGACYRPPHSTPDFARKLIMLNDLTTEYPNARILLFGDFNHPLIDWVN